MLQVEKVMNLSELKPIKSEGLDLKQFHNKQVKIESAKVVQVSSTFTPLIEGSTKDHIPQWVLKVESEVVATLGDGEDKLEFRASELFNLVQDEKGILEGYPDNEKANLVKFMNDIGAKNPSEIVGKMVTIKSYDKMNKKDGTIRTYLKFKY